MSLTPTAHPSPIDLARRRTPRFDADYEERVYAGLLGKAIGVYLGRPIEGWTYDRVTREVGEVDRYVSEELGKRLLLTDDDIAGTVVFVRAAEESGYDTTAEQIGAGWLNHLIENRSVLWWGGMGNSTEHTAYLRLKSGLRPPESGAAKTNGLVVSEQIGAQIFVDGWAMISPQAPALAAELAGRAGIVSHDGEAVHAARALAAMEAAAFGVADVATLVEVALAVLPEDSLIAQMTRDLRAWRREGIDWRRARERLDARYGYDVYGGNCHVIPNHGLIVLALLWGEGDFSRSLMIVNTSGWDTDCNSGNLGALLGIARGLDAIDDSWRTPVGDRIYVPTGDVGEAITDIAREARRIARSGRSAAGASLDEPGARFDFRFPGSVQGFHLFGERLGGVEHVVTAAGERGIGVLGAGRDEAEAVTATFALPDEFDMGAYALDASPTLYPGQELVYRVRVTGSAVVTPLVRHYGAGDTLLPRHGEPSTLAAGSHELRWRVPDLGGEPIALVGLEARAAEAGSTVAILSLDWEGAPTVTFRRPSAASTVWRRSWVSTLDYTHDDPPEAFRLVSNGEQGLLMTGVSDWTDYRVSAEMVPHMGDAFGIAARVQGLRRYVLLRVARGGEVELVERFDDEERILGRGRHLWEDQDAMRLELEVLGSEVVARIDGDVVAAGLTRLSRGHVALAAECARVGVHEVAVAPF